MAQQHYLIGYGSLLSHDSRLRYSNINCQPLPITVKGWKRAWVTRSTSEKQTYVGAKPKAGASLNAILIPIEDIDQKLRHREQDYEFVKVNTEQVEYQANSFVSSSHSGLISGASLWICQSNVTHEANDEHPIYQSYVDTCLAGCIESKTADFAERFVSSTHGWETNWLDDRKRPQYPRAAKVSLKLQRQIDALLGKLNVLHFRKNAINETHLYRKTNHSARYTG